MPYNRIHLQVGIFSTLALVLLMVGILLLAKGSFFKEAEEYVLYFEGSVAGLTVGAPVVFRGVPLGRVTSISLVADDKSDTVTIPVGIDILKGSIRHIGAPGGVTEAERHEMIQRMIERGLRARIAIASLLTGQARIELDFHPETPARYHSANHQSEIPTLSSPLEEFSRALARIHIDKIGNSLFQALENFNSVMTSEELRDSLVGFKQLADEASVLVREMPALLESFQKALQGLEMAADRTAHEVPRIGHEMRVTLDSFGKAAERAEKLFLDAGRLTAPNSATVRDLQGAMKELAEAAKAIRSLAKSLERNPESLLRGRGRQ